MGSFKVAVNISPPHVAKSMFKQYDYTALLLWRQVKSIMEALGLYCKSFHTIVLKKKLKSVDKFRTYVNLASQNRLKTFWENSKKLSNSLYEISAEGNEMFLTKLNTV